MKTRILIAEDEESLAAGLEYGLGREGHEVVLAKDGEQALALARQERFDLILLDVMMPKKSGFDVLKALRDDGHAVPIILLTAKGQELDKVRGLDLGADDYVTKPFSLSELAARIRARLKRGAGLGAVVPDVLEFGGLRVDLAALRIERGAEHKEISVKEADMLRLLWRERGRPVARERFLREVWHLERAPSTRTVDQHVVKLRQKLEIDPENPRHIVTVFGVGYRLEA